MMKVGTKAQLFNQIEGEIWKDVVGFEGLYSVSNLQRVRSEKRKSNNHWTTVCERILRAGKHSFGYPKFTLCKDGKFHYVQLHRLVAEAFIPNPNNLPCINHIDNNPLNNAIENLEWCTWSFNSRYAYKQERLSKVGEKNHMSKLSEKEVLEIFNSKEGRQILSKRYNVSFQTVYDIRVGRRWYMITGKRHPAVKQRICEQ